MTLTFIYCCFIYSICDSERIKAIEHSFGACLFLNVYEIKLKNNFFLKIKIKKKIDIGKYRDRIGKSVSGNIGIGSEPI